MLRVTVFDMQLPIFSACGLSIKKLRTQEQRDVLRPRCLSFLSKIFGTMVLGKARQGNFIYIALFIHKADSKCFTYKHCYTIK